MITITSDSPLKEDPNEWMKKPYLFKSDLAALNDGKYLTCRLIDGSMELLKNVDKDIGGWQSVTREYFSKVQGAFVQIVLVNNNHWITVSNVKCPPRTVYVYDSMFAVLDRKTQAKICSIWRPQWKFVNYKMVNFQVQTNSKDCGLFAIAVATELAHGREPRWCTWNIKRMRGHLREGLELGQIDPFPLAKPRCIPSSSEFKGMPYRTKIYCHCRMPNETSRSMVSCDVCEEWYHRNCVNLCEEEDLSGVDWTCMSCQHKVKK